MRGSLLSRLGRADNAHMKGRSPGLSPEIHIVKKPPWGQDPLLWNLSLFGNGAQSTLAGRLLIFLFSSLPSTEVN